MIIKDILPFKPLNKCSHFPLYLKNKYHLIHEKIIYFLNYMIKLLYEEEDKKVLYKHITFI